jgi:NarL family two-component system response regulator LiaR
MTGRSIRVLVADDHPLVRQGLRAYLSLQPDLEVVGEATGGDEAILRARALGPDVVLMDLLMPGLDGVEAMRRLGDEAPACRVVVLTSAADEDHVLAAMRAGASGYVLKDAPPADVVAAVRRAVEGGAVIDPNVAPVLLREARRERARDPLEALTRREREVLALVARGLPNKRIAAELGVAEKTVKTHVSSVLRKLGVHDRTQAALLAARAGLGED